jgi:NAD(P)-dependent dehydrogenase (short-subunit alcohol dehydrogenase family)
MRFEHKVAAITGGGSGIGKETAKRFVAEGGKVAINGRDVAKLEAAAHEIDPTGSKVVVVAGDVANPATGVALVDAAVSRFGRLNVLANNAGVFTPKPFLKLTEADYDWNVDNILKGSFFVAQAAAKAMKETGGAIVQTGSMWAIQAIGATLPPPIPLPTRASTRWCATSRSNWPNTRFASMPSPPPWSRRRSTTPS